jgi:hypothetical protein
MPTKANKNGITPFQALVGQPPSDLDRARVFGCDAYVLIPKEERKGKLEAKARKGRYIGESNEGADHLILINNRPVRAVHVTFNEKGQKNSHTSEDDEAINQLFDSELDDTTTTTATAAHNDDGDSASGAPNDRIPHTTEADSTTSTTTAVPTATAATAHAKHYNNVFTMLEEMSSAWAFATIGDPMQPSINQAMQGPERDEWEAVIKKEMDGLLGKVLRPMKEADVPAGQQILPSKMLLKQKVNAAGKNDKKKARLVVIGCVEKIHPDVSHFAP